MGKVFGEGVAKGIWSEIFPIVPNKVGMGKNHR